MRNFTIVFFLLCLLGCGFVNAQSWIQKDLGLPTGNSVLHISIADADVAWCLSNGNGQRKFSKTTDTGLTWRAATLTGVPTVGQLVDIVAIDSSTAYVLKSQPTELYKTTDGGTQWTRLGDSTFFSNPSSYADALYFWDASNGFIFGDPVNGHPEMYHTSDAGNTWMPVDTNNIPPTSMGTFLDWGPLSVVDSMMWIPTIGGQLLKSTDRGQHWSATMLDSLGGLLSLAFLDDGLHGLVFGSKIWRTSDGGSTWDTIPASNHGPGLTVKGIPGTTTFVSLNGNMSVMSTDFGNSWMVIDSGAHMYGGLEFYDINTGFAGGIPSILHKGIYKWSATTVGNLQPLEVGEMNLFPNPGSTTVKVRASQEIERILVHDVLGHAVLQQVVGAKEALLDLTELRSGVYFVGALTAQGKITRKYIKR